MKLRPPPSPTLLLLLLAAYAASAATIPLGSTLYASDPNSKWSSSNNTFTLSFIPDPSSPAGALIAAVSYNNVPIWQASASASASSVLRLLPSGDLQLLPSASSAAPLWSSGTTNRGVSTASLEESGNFVLNTSSGAAAWSSFDHPTDTIVPTQTLNLNRTLTSGMYSFRIQRNGNLMLLWNNSITYFNSSLNTDINPPNLSNPVLDIQSTGILTLSDPTLSTAIDLAYSSDYAEENHIFRFIRLDTDGNLRIYSSSGNNGTATATWSAVSDQCQVFGFCGNLGICSYNGTSPICGCPSEHFSPVDPSDSRKGCRRKVELQWCVGRETMLQLDHTKFLTFEPELSSELFYTGTEPCRSNCLVGPCTASTSLSDGSGQCYLKWGTFVCGSQSPATPSTSFVKVCSLSMPDPSPAMMMCYYP